ncbi:MAG: hypothetical protein Q4B14_06065, partial [Clostridia bacterium]|nr:hypothetical protein [Clostridia bacterium]
MKNDIFNFEDLNKEKKEDYYNSYSEYSGYSQESKKAKNSHNEYQEDINEEIIGAEYINEKGKRQKKLPKHTLIIMQIISCALIIAGILTVKNFFPEYYEVFCSWYKPEIDKSVIIGEDSKNYEITQTDPTLKETENESNAAEKKE